MFRNRLAISLLVLLMGSAAGCYELSSHSPERPSFVFGCEDGYTFTVSFNDDSALLHLPDRTIRLPHVISADGARYSDGRITFWNKGNTARVELGDRVYEHCVTPPAKAP